jgi:hypothetical protein
MRLKHRIGGWLRAMSLLLCGAFLLLGVRSCDRMDMIRWTTDHRHFEVVTIPWSVRITVATPNTAPRPISWEVNPMGHGSPPIFGARPMYRTWYYFGVGIKRDTRTWYDVRGGRQTTAYTIVSMPFQLLAFICFLPMTWQILTIRHRRRIRDSRMANSECVNCGYDMRFSTDRCPECGERAPVRALL